MGQARSNFAVYRVPQGPNRLTDLKLPGGTYCLSSRSNIPYIRLIGGSTSQKIFGWNEEIIVPEHELVTVQNASYHGGDIIINSGMDYSAKPSRITVPVGIVDNGVGADPRFTPEYPLDTRRAQRAFLYGFRTPVGGANMDIVVTQQAETSSFPQGPTSLGEGGGVTATLSQTVTVPAGTDINGFPLGQGASSDDSVHALLDSVTFELPAAAQSLIGDAANLIYVLEFL